MKGLLHAREMRPGRTPGAARARPAGRRLAASSIGHVMRTSPVSVTSPEELFDEMRRRAPESEQRLYSVGQIVEGTMKIASHVVRHGSALRSRPWGIGWMPLRIGRTMRCLDELRSMLPAYAPCVRRARPTRACASSESPPRVHPTPGAAFESSGLLLHVGEPRGANGTWAETAGGRVGGFPARTRRWKGSVEARIEPRPMESRGYVRARACAMRVQLHESSAARADG